MLSEGSDSIADSDDDDDDGLVVRGEDTSSSISLVVDDVPFSLMKSSLAGGGDRSSSRLTIDAFIVFVLLYLFDSIAILLYYINTVSSVLPLLPEECVTGDCEGHCRHLKWYISDTLN